MSSKVKQFLIAVCGRLRVAVTLLAAAWCTFALHFNSLIPNLLATGLAAGYLTATAVVWYRSKDWSRFYAVFVPASLAAFLLWCCVRPSHEPTTVADGAWSRLHAVMPRVDFVDNHVTIHNVRKTRYESDGSYMVEHKKQTYELDQLDSVWFGEQHFARFQGLAHTFVTFGFRDGEFLSISAEARRGEREDFSPLRGFFKQYGLIYVVSTEQDAIGRNLSELPIYLYPIRASQSQIQGMFVQMLRRADELRERPEFYHTAHNNCASNIVDSFNEIAPIHFSQYSPFLALPGFAGKVAYNRGLIDTDEQFSVVQRQACINELARSAGEQDFSRYIRSNFEMKK